MCTMSGTAQPGIFRPWAAVKPPSRSRHRSYRSHHHPQQQQQQPVRSPSPPATLVGAVAEIAQQHSADSSQHAMLSSSPMAMPSAADLYAELSRADLARLGLVCPADLARLKARKQRPKKYRCPHCNVAFSNNGQLRGHIRIHTGERPFACAHDGCGKAFTRNEELTRHRRIHSGLRPFPCPSCGKRFGRKDHLKKHVRTHQKAAMMHSAHHQQLAALFHQPAAMLLQPPSAAAAAFFAASAAAAAAASGSRPPFGFC